MTPFEGSMSVKRAPIDNRYMGILGLALSPSLGGEIPPGEIPLPQARGPINSKTA